MADRTNPDHRVNHTSCMNPVWPCAMAGAVSCLAGVRDLAVVIHGSSGCYYYPATLMPGELFGTFLQEPEVIFGGGERLAEVLRTIPPRYRKIAVVTTCVTAVTGEDPTEISTDRDLLVVDSPGFCGGMEEGYRLAMESLAPAVDPETPGVNLDGIHPADPFSRGNVREAERMLALAGTNPATIFTETTLDMLHRAAPVSLSVNPDLAEGAGRRIGSLLGLRNVRESFQALARACPGSDPEPVLREADRAEERITYVADKYLSRHDPPTVAIFGMAAPAVNAAEMLATYLDCGIAAIGSRNKPGPARFPVAQMTSLEEIRAVLDREQPDLILGSSYERMVYPQSAFVGITLPLRGRIQLRARPLAGIEGALDLMEQVLNACMDRARGRK
jgi:nitrogenase molybdenum-iron protein alpha/beta subunit